MPFERVIGHQCAPNQLIARKTEASIDLMQRSPKSLDEGWAQKVKSFTYSYWAVFLISLPVVFLFQWSDLCLVPLVSGDPGNFVVDWGRIAILRPELISVPAAIAFTGLAYLFMGVCVFLFFVGLILLTTTAHDLWEIWKDIEFQSHDSGQREAHEVASHVMYGIFRCSVLGLLISICLKLQSAFLTSDAETIVDWLIDDLLFLSSPRDEISVELGYNIPTHFSSFLAVLAICSVFLYGSVRIHAILAHSRLTKSDDDAVERIQFKSRVDRGFMPWRKMIVVMALLVAAYLSIGMFSGFSILLCIGLALAIFGLFDPKLGLRRAT